MPTFEICNEDDAFSGWPTIYTESPLGWVVFVIVGSTDDNVPAVQVFPLDPEGAVAGDYTEYQAEPTDDGFQHLPALRRAMFDVFSKETPDDERLRKLLAEVRS